MSDLQKMQEETERTMKEASALFQDVRKWKREPKLWKRELGDGTRFEVAYENGKWMAGMDFTTKFNGVFSPGSRHDKPEEAIRSAWTDYQTCKRWEAARLLKESVSQPESPDATAGGCP